MNPSSTESNSSTNYIKKITSLRYIELFAIAFTSENPSLMSAYIMIYIYGQRRSVRLERAGDTAINIHTNCVKVCARCRAHYLHTNKQTAHNNNCKHHTNETNTY